MGGFAVKSNIALTVTVCIASFEAIIELQREKLHQSRAAAFIHNGQMRGQFLQAKAEYLHHCLVIVHTERGQWQASFVCEKSACLAEVSVMGKFYGNFQIPRNSGKTEHTQTVCSRLHTREPGNEVRSDQACNYLG